MLISNNDNGQIDQEYDHCRSNEKGTDNSLTKELTVIRSLFMVLLMFYACFQPHLHGFEVVADEFDKQSLPLFDGETLAGWEGNAYWFRVEEGAIVAGRLDEEIPHNEFLCTTQPYDDFELQLEAKLIGDGQNAGIQIRSKRLPKTTEVSGYQVDMGQAGKRGVWGALYDESRRNRMLAEVDPQVHDELVKKGEWNHYRIICRGRIVTIYLNGKKTVEYQEAEESIPLHGIIGLQIHSGAPSEAWYRNIRIRQL